MLNGMLYPTIHASNEENEEDKMSARVMRILIEDHLRKAGYENKFLYMVLSALVNPAVLVEIDYLIAYQRINQKLASGEIKVLEAIDEFLTGLVLNVLTVDQLLIADFFTPNVQLQPFVIKVERISYGTARKIYGQHLDFKFVQSGKTRIVMAGQEKQTLYDIEWTEADKNYVQKLTFFYRDEDLEVVFIGGVFMGNKENIYKNNSFKHRRLSVVKDEWVSIPIYPFASSFFEPIDPTGRFFYGKSGAFKEYWDDATQNKMHQLLIDGTYLDVIKPTFVQGLAKVDSTVMAPGAVVGIPTGSSITQYSLGPNLPAAMQALKKQEEDMSESTQDKIMSGNTSPYITATQSEQAVQQARIFIGVFSNLLAWVVRQIGDLVTDCEVQHTTSAELDFTIPGALRLKQKVLLAKSKYKGKDITNRIVFTDKYMGKKMTKEEINKYEWKLWREKGGEGTDQEIYHVNPYKFARMKYSSYADPDAITNAAMGNNRMRKLTSFQILTDPRVAPFTDPKAVADDIIEEFSIGDPDKFKAKQTVDVNALMSSIVGNPGGGSPPVQQRAMAPLQNNLATQ